MSRVVRLIEIRCHETWSVVYTHKSNLIPILECGMDITFHYCGDQAS